TETALTAAISASKAADVIAPLLAMTDVAQAEGNSGTTVFEFDVALLNASTLPVSVNYSTFDDSAKAGDDYVATSGVLTWPPGDTLLRNVFVDVTADGFFEYDESFGVLLSLPLNAALRKDIGLGIIQGDDPFAY